MQVLGHAAKMSSAVVGHTANSCSAVVGHAAKMCSAVVGHTANSCSAVVGHNANSYSAVVGHTANSYGADRECEHFDGTRALNGDGCDHLDSKKESGCLLFETFREHDRYVMLDIFHHDDGHPDCKKKNGYGVALLTSLS